MPKTCALVFICFTWCCAVMPAMADEGSTSAQCPPENPPRILVANSIDSDDHLVLVSYHSIFIGFSGESYNERLTKRVSLEYVQILTVAGKKITVEAARQAISDRDTPIVATSYKKPLPSFYAAMFNPQTLQFVFAKKAPQWREIESPGARVER